MTQSAILLSVCLLGGQSSAAATQPPASGAKAQPQKTTPPNPLFKAVQNLYEKQSFESAEAIVDEALASPNTEEADRTQFYVLKGLLRAERGDEEKAREAFQSALSRDYDAKLPDVAPPKTVQLFAQVRAETPRPKKEITVVTKPPQPQPSSGGFPFDFSLAATERPITWIPIGVGGAATVGGVVFLVLSRQIDASLRVGNPNIQSPQSLTSELDRGRVFQTTGLIMTGVGVAALVGGVGWRYYSPQSPSQGVAVGATITPGGMVSTVSGSFP
jgi:tetratricopeptide (TPR) repeat protein